MVLYFIKTFAKVIKMTVKIILKSVPYCKVKKILF